MDPDGFKTEDLDLLVLEKTLNSPALSNLELVYLCGNHGDPIYHRDFHDAIRLFRERGLMIELETNGSHRKESWWEDFAALLIEEDLISFSVDGLARNNQIYRVNSDWDSIIRGMKVMANSKAWVNWKWIMFKYNEDDVVEAQELAESLGFDAFTIVRSGLFGEQYADETGKDPLEPRDENRIWFPGHETKTQIFPRCQKQPRPFISAQGQFIPCCWAGNAWAYNGGFFDQNRDALDLKKNDLSEILQSKTLNELEESWATVESAPKECVSLCGRREEPEGWNSEGYKSSYDKKVIQLKKIRL